MAEETIQPEKLAVTAFPNAPRDIRHTKQTRLSFSSLKRERAETPELPESIKRRRTASPPPLKTSTPPKTAVEDLTPYLHLISHSTKTPYQKRVLTLLCQVPRGHHTTYAALSAHLRSSPRAVGNALRNNPFAPHVPCHRVLASGGGLGGFGGSWGRKGEDGKNDEEKRRLLRGEGVRFDGRGRVVGRVWDGFK